MENRKKVSQFVKDWMNGHEPDTFIRNGHGVAIYSAGPSSLNIESFFEELLLDYQESLIQPKEISDKEIEKMAKEANNIPVDLIIDEEERYYKNFLKYDGFIEGFKKCQAVQQNKMKELEHINKALISLMNEFYEGMTLDEVLKLPTNQTDNK